MVHRCLSLPHSSPMTVATASVMVSGESCHRSGVGCFLASHPAPTPKKSTKGEPMPISPSEAATIAHKHGLSLQDAAGLLSLADSTDEADRIAATFAAPATTSASLELTRRLFGHQDQADEETPPAPRPPAPTADLEMRRITRRLFDRPDPAA